MSFSLRDSPVVKLASFYIYTWCNANFYYWGILLIIADLRAGRLGDYSNQLSRFQYIVINHSLGRQHS